MATRQIMVTLKAEQGEISLFTNRLGMSRSGKNRLATQDSEWLSVSFHRVFFAATRRTMFVSFQESYECFVLGEG